MIDALIRHRELLHREFEYEREEFRRQTMATAVEQKVRRGNCWYPLSVGRSYRNSLDQLVVEVHRVTSDDEEHNFEPGKPICFFEVNKAISRQDNKSISRGFGEGEIRRVGERCVCTVSYVEGDRMVVAVPSQDVVLQLQNADLVGVELTLDESTYRLMFDALDRVIAAKGNRLAELRDICHTSAPAHKYTFLPQRFPWLNPSQEQAVNEVLWAKDVAVVHGPPGTGKTTTMVEAIYETLHRETQVLVCAQSNMAVDWIAEKLCDRGVNVLRIGNPTRVTDRMLEQTYERRFEAHPQYTQLWGIRKAIRDLYAQRKHGNTDSFQQKVSRLKERAMELEYSIQEQLFQEARVVACTLTGSANRLLVGRRFGTLFIDEAAQAFEAACWIAIPKADRFVLAGDHMQLGPTMKSPTPNPSLEGRGVPPAVTLMQHIVANKPRCVSLLKVQYRMCDEIMQFPNREFYDGMLESAPNVKYRGILDWDTAVTWITSPGPSQGGEPEIHGESYSNPVEAEQTLRVLQEYFEKIGKERILSECIDVGLISPYRGQVRLLRQMLRRNAFFKPFRSLITINTVDGFQGQERDVIVISMVRSNEDGQVGFLRDLRRMNVAITRARMKLIIIGDDQTICRHPFYRRLKKYIDSLGE